MKHPGFTGIDDSSLPTYGRYTWLDHLLAQWANDISHPMEQPYVPDHKVTQFSDYGKFYRTFQVLGSNAKVSFRYLKKPDTVTNLQGAVADNRRRKAHQ
jgi:hypothetical protein